MPMDRRSFRFTIRFTRFAGRNYVSNDGRDSPEESTFFANSRMDRSAASRRG